MNTAKMFVHIMNLVARILHSSPEEENLCREVLQVQQAMGWPGLIHEVKEFCQKIGLPDNTREYSCRKDIHQSVQYYDMKMVKENIKQEKYSIIRERDGRFVQPYMFEKNLLQSRVFVGYIHD